MNLGLAGRHAIVTGGTRGIGEAVAHELAAEGADVAVIGRDGSAATRIADEISRAHKVRALGVAGDLAVPADVDAAFAEAIDILGSVDILVNNAGSSAGGGFDQCTDADWQAAIDLKLLGYVRAIRCVLEPMRLKGSGRIVNVVGMSGRHANPDYVLGAVNAALLHLTKTLALTLAGDGIVVTAVNPHLVETERVMGYLEMIAEEKGTDPATLVDALVSTLPLGRMGTPTEVARLVVIMASDVTAYATGSALQADGGNTPIIL